MWKIMRLYPPLLIVHDSFLFFLQNGEIAMLGEITHLQAIIDDLTVLTTDPHKLPPASEQVRHGRTACGTRNVGGGRGEVIKQRPSSLSGDHRSEGVRLQLVLSDPPFITEQLRLPQEQHVQVQAHTRTHLRAHSRHTCIRKRSLVCFTVAFLYVCESVCHRCLSGHLHVIFKSVSSSL